MKRSEINAHLREADAFFRRMGFLLPPWAHWTPEQWQRSTADTREIVDNQLGWDLTDFGAGDFLKRGLTLFTIRNGKPPRYPKPYAEKVLLTQEEQETPCHFHWAKMEDIINRGGGKLVFELFNCTANEEVDTTSRVRVMQDGIVREYAAGERVVLEPGESLCLTPGLYHRFYAQRGSGPVLVGEVSCVNDDTTDNRFAEPMPRFPALEEDEAPWRLLTIDYAKWLGSQA